MSDNRKYYYLKLKENYFDDDSIVLLESMQDGVLYSNILLKLYLKSLKHGGRLQLDEDIPYTAQMIATITRQQIGTVERALQIFLKLGLVEVLDSGTFYMYAAIAPIPLSTFAGEPTSSVGKNFIRSYAGVCLQGVVIALSCIIFSAISSSPPAVDTGASVVTAVWTYVGELAFNLLVLVGAIKGCDRIVKEIMGL